MRKTKSFQGLLSLYKGAFHNAVYNGFADLCFFEIVKLITVMCIGLAISVCHHQRQCRHMLSSSSPNSVCCNFVIVILLSHHTAVWGILSLLCFFVRAVTEGRKILHASSTTIRDELLLFW